VEKNDNNLSKCFNGKVRVENCQQKNLSKMYAWIIDNNLSNSLTEKYTFKNDNRFFDKVDN
jgi:hypothetical protein